MTVSTYGVTAHGRRHFTITVTLDDKAYLFGGDAEGWCLVDGQVDTDTRAREAAVSAYAGALEAFGKLGPATALSRGLGGQ